MQAEIGIIGGTGLYDPKLLKNVQEVMVETPYGKPSDSITVGELGGKCVAFLPRHGKKHTIRPTDINVRANIFALKKLGVKRILAPSTVGSLREEYHPGEIVFCDQFIDRTTRREQSFYTQDRGLPHNRRRADVPRTQGKHHFGRQNIGRQNASNRHLRLHRGTTLLD